MHDLEMYLADFYLKYYAVKSEVSEILQINTTNILLQILNYAITESANKFIII